MGAVVCTFGSELVWQGREWLENIEPQVIRLIAVEAACGSLVNS